ncbi:MAG: polymerase subunit gamma and tau, polymerase subunit gamma/tau protein [Candidatus Kaiserbacteria bacterium]|nr:polymerase subunit gamma and tau, polymerase subunit gamma/tau protein [Candidatus Kaiserbacteria bacterium]
MTETEHSTLYRTYRPGTFEEMKGQEHIVTALTQSIKSGKIAHAYLFSGGRGTGKTTAARILAKSLGVSNKDIIEMDAASNRGIDDIRELREGVWVMPFESPYNLYIIDEAHMLTKEAWNALLKTLEEPPSHVIFVLATTERDKVPETIQSRCEIHTFRQPSRELLFETVTRVAKEEGFALEPAGAELVALLAEGSFRDALSILQKVLGSASGKKIDIAHVEQMSGAPRGEIVRTFVRAIGERNTAQALTAIGIAVKENIDMRTFTKLIINRLRIVLLTRFAPDLANDLSAELTEADATLITELSKNKNVTSDTLRTILEAYSQMAYAAVPHLPLELAVVDMAKEPL